MTIVRRSAVREPARVLGADRGDLRALYRVALRSNVAAHFGVGLHERGRDGVDDLV